MRANRIPWVDGVLQTNPVADTVLVISPALPKGMWAIHWTIFCNATGLFALQLIDANGTDVLKSQRFTTSMQSTALFQDLLVEVTTTGQKVRIIVLENVTGVAQVSLY